MSRLMNYGQRPFESSLTHLELVTGPLVVSGGALVYSHSHRGFSPVGELYHVISLTVMTVLEWPEADD